MAARKGFRQATVETDDEGEEERKPSLESSQEDEGRYTYILAKSTANIAFLSYQVRRPERLDPESSSTVRSSTSTLAGNLSLDE